MIYLKLRNILHLYISVQLVSSYNLGLPIGQGIYAYCYLLIFKRNYIHVLSTQTH